MIQYVLAHQLVKNWVLDECDYRNQFEYGWEQESLLSTLFSIANPLAGPCIWRTNTAVYPWRLSLKRLDTTGRPEMYVRRRHNNIELGDSTFSLDSLMKVCRVLLCSSDYLLFGSGIDAEAWAEPVAKLQQLDLKFQEPVSKTIQGLIETIIKAEQ